MKPTITKENVETKMVGLTHASLQGSSQMTGLSVIPNERILQTRSLLQQQN